MKIGNILKLSIVHLTKEKLCKSDVSSIFYDQICLNLRRYKSALLSPRVKNIDIAIIFHTTKKNNQDQHKRDSNK